MAVIAIDFDGTIVENKYPEVGSLIPGAKECIQRLVNDGHEIIINTCRAGEYEGDVYKFMRDNGIPYDYINSNIPRIIQEYRQDCRKISADIYIGDRQLGGLPPWETIYDTINKQLGVEYKELGDVRIGLLKGIIREPNAHIYDRIQTLDITRRDIDLIHKLNNLAANIHNDSIRKGHWDSDRERGTLLMLIVSELGEALEADRKGRMPHIEAFLKDTEGLDQMINEDQALKWMKTFELYIKDSYHDELVDALIRILDLIAGESIDLNVYMPLKMKYNQLREYKNGKKY